MEAQAQTEKLEQKREERKESGEGEKASSNEIVNAKPSPFEQSKQSQANSVQQSGPKEYGRNGLAVENGGAKEADKASTGSAFGNVAAGIAVAAYQRNQPGGETGLITPVGEKQDDGLQGLIGKVQSNDGKGHIGHAHFGVKAHNEDRGSASVMGRDEDDDDKRNPTDPAMQILVDKMIESYLQQGAAFQQGYSQSSGFGVVG
jgi:hypothetical protein